MAPEPGAEHVDATVGPHTAVRHQGHAQPGRSPSTRNAAPGWWGLGALSLLYGTAFTILFTLLPKLGVVGSSPILNVEPVAALGMAWLLLDQAIAPMQVLGALIVVGTVMVLGLRRRR